MYTKKSLVEHLKNITGAGFWGVNFEIKPNVNKILKALDEDDEILACRFSIFSSLGGGDFLLLQDRILFFVDSGLVPKQVELYLSNIASFNKTQVLQTVNLEIADTSGKKYKFTNITDKVAKTVIKHLQKLKQPV